MIINHNIAALNTYRQMSFNSASTQNNIEKLSSGFRINKASDDAAGLAISEKMRGQIRGLDQANRNAQDAISLIQTAEGGLSETHSILQRMRELAVQSANDTATDSDRSEMQKEISQLKSEIDRISSDTEFNTKKLLNGNLTGAKALQGTKAASAVFDAATTAATSGTSKAGLQVAISEAAAGTTGEGYSKTAGAELAERTIIQTGVNDTFKIQINNATTTASVTIAASTSEGYTRSQFVDALNSAIKTAVTDTNWANQFNQVVVSLTDDNQLKITTATQGSSATLGVVVSAATADKGALEAMGFAAKQTTITGNEDLTDGISTTTSDATYNIAIQLGAHATVTVDLMDDGGLAASTAADYSFEQVKTALQTALDKEVGSGAITVGDDGQGHLKLTSNVATGSFLLITATQTATLFGTSLTSSDVLQAANLTTKGVNTVNAVKAGTVISAGANDKFKISVDGGEAKTITLNAGNYATRQDLVTEISNQINSDESLVGKVRVQLAADNSGKIEFISASTGSSSDVSISNPTFANESALSALGYAGSAGGITGTENLAPGINLTTATNTAKMDVTLGNKTVTIDLAGHTGIYTNGAATISDVSSRDAIVQALQAELDDAFGEGAITVNTSTTPAGVDTLALSNNTRTGVFKIEDGANGGATKLFGADKIADVSVAGVNVELDGTDAVDNTIANSTKLTDLADADSNNLGLVEGNLIKISGTQNGEGFSTSLTVGANTTLNDLQNAIRELDAFHDATISLDTKTGQINVSGANGETKDISNLAFVAQKSSTDSTIVSGFNSLFGSFNVTQQAQNASSDNSLKMQIGANEAQTLSVDISDMGTDALRLTSIDISTKDGAQSGISVINNALEMVSSERSKLGALQNRLEHTINNLGTSSENLTASESRIRDVDMAKEMMEFTKNNVLTQAAQAMLAQANQQPQQVLQLLR